MSDAATVRSQRSGELQAEFLDRHSWLPVVLLCLLPFLIQLPFWLLGLSTDPMGFFSGITISPHAPTRWPVLDPNAGFTTQALGRLAASDWVHGIVPWWNPYTGIGMPLAGEMQPGAFFLPFNLLLLLRDGVLWQRIAMQILTGLTTYGLLRELKISRLAAFMGGALYACNGVIAWTPGPGAVYCSIPFFPLLLWGIERARKPLQGAISILAIGLAIAWMILAGFPEPAYISGLLGAAWGVYRLATSPTRVVLAGRALGGFFLGLLVTAPLLLAFVDYLAQSDSFSAHTATQMSLSWRALPATLMPYIFGPLTFSLAPRMFELIWASIGGYTGVLVIVLALVGAIRRPADRGLKLLLLVWVVVAWARTFGVQPITAIINHLPLLGQAYFHRYSGASWILALTVLAAYGLDEFRDGTPKRRYAFGIVLVLLAICIVLAWPQRAVWGWPPATARMMLRLLGASVFWGIATLTALGLAWSIRDSERRRTIVACLLIVDAAAMFAVGLTGATRNSHVDTPAIQFLRDHQGLARTYTFGPLQPNYSAYFQIASIDHNVLPAPKLWAEYAEHNLLPGVQKDSDGVIFWPAWVGYKTHLGIPGFLNNLSSFREVGVQYVMTLPGQEFESSLAQHGLMKVYSDTVTDIWELPQPAPYYQVVEGGPCTLTAELREQVTADCVAPATLRRRELYMPGWTVARDHAAAQPVSQDHIFQADALPAGLSTARYHFIPPHMEFGWLACLLGFVGLAIQVARIGLDRRRGVPVIKAI